MDWADWSTQYIDTFLAEARKRIPSMRSRVFPGTIRDFAAVSKQVLFYIGEGMQHRGSLFVGEGRSVKLSLFDSLEAHRASLIEAWLNTEIKMEGKDD